MRRILKYKLEIRDKQPVSLPPDVAFRHVAEDSDGPLVLLWCSVLESSNLVEFEVIIRATGEDDPESYRCEYVGTVIGVDGVWHVFVRRITE